MAELAHTQQIRQRAAKRLLRDYAEFQECDNFDNIVASPLENNIFEWHANLTAPDGPYAGLVLHLIINFTDDYPCNPPTVALQTTLTHPNVFGSFICLDMLKSYTRNEPYRGWSTAYSVCSILLQLQSFLFAENVPQDYVPVDYSIKNVVRSENVKNAFKLARKFKCSAVQCPHKGTNPWPQLKRAPKIKRECAIASSLSDLSIGNRQLKDLDADTTQHFLSFLSAPNLLRAARAHPHWANIIRAHCMLERLEMVCFHTRKSAHEAVLGCGLQAEYFRNGKIKSLTTEINILSWNAFESGKVRTSVWGQRVSHFLPLAINGVHSRKAMPILKKCIGSIVTDGARMKRVYQADSTAFQVLEVVCTLMNSMVVSLFLSEDKEKQNTDPTQIHRHASEKALLGYCLFHQLLLRLAVEHPEIRALALRRVQEFMKSPEARLKSTTPDLGRFLVLLTLVRSVKWVKIAIVFMKEVFARNVRWIGKDAPELLRKLPGDDSVNHDRLNKTFELTKTSRGLIMFQVSFMKLLCTPGLSIQEQLKSYDQRMGRSTAQQQHDLLQTARACLAVSSWDDYFDRCRVQRPSPAFLTTLLKKAVEQSRQSGYHGGSRRRRY
eukprot:108250_1